MKRATALFDRIASPGNLLAAHLKARKGKTSRPEVRRFSADLDASLASLREQLLAGDYMFNRYHRFTIYDPKERVISAAPFSDRVLHHAVMNLCGPVFERVQIFDSYACRPDKGALAALKRAADFSRRFPFFLKLDVRTFFDSIPHERLKAQLNRLFKEPRLLALFVAVIEGYESYAGHTGAGLPIGNLTSQYFANHYLAGLDHYARETLRVPGYVRYMDDMVLWGPSTRQLLRWEEAFRGFCKTRLGLVLKPPCINRAGQGLPFLGFVVFPGEMRLSARSCRRIRGRLASCEKALEQGKIDQAAAADKVRGVLARTDWCTGASLRRKLLPVKIGRRPRASSE